MSQFDMEMNPFAEYLIPAKRSLYDHVYCESEIERDFAKGLDALEDVILYVKLPSWFTIATPIGEYNPDWAIVIKNPDDNGVPLLYLVRETKYTTDLSKLPPDEANKVRCGERHFRDALNVNFKVVTEIKELLSNQKDTGKG